MDAFYHCISAVLYECEKTGLIISKDVCKIDNSIDINFDLPINRIAFLYKFGTFNIHFFKKCFLDFASDCPGTVVLERMISSKLVCSLSNGPGTDIIGLQFALKELGKTFNPNTFFKIISKYGSWRNAMNSLIESRTATINPIIGSFKLLQCNVMESLSSKAENCLKSADIVLMDHAFASRNAQGVKILDALKILLQILKPGAYIFFIDTKNKVSYFELLNSYGTYIYGPKEVKVDDVPYNDKVAEQIGEQPVCFGKAYFGVWQKNIITESIMADGTSVVNVIPAAVNFDKDRSVENMPATSNPMKVQLKNRTNGHASLVNVVPAIQRQNNSCKNNKTPQLQISTKNLSASVILTKLCDESKGENESCSFTDQQANLITKQNVTNTETDCTQDIKVLLHSLNNLVSKLENFLSSEITCRNTSFLSCGKYIPLCHNQCFNYYQCCINKRSCSQYCEERPIKDVSSNSNRSCNCHAASKII